MDLYYIRPVLTECPLSFL